MKVEVYADRAIFESILLDAVKYPHWHAILLKHSTVLLNLTDQELIDDLADPENSIITQYCLSSGGSEPQALKNYFDYLRATGYAQLETKPTALFLLDLHDDDVKSLRDELGIYVANLDLIEDHTLSFEHYLVYEKNQICQDHNSEGWHCINKFSRVELNSIIINDTHLFDNDYRQSNCGVENLIHFIDTMLPQKLSIPFHVLVLAENKKNKNLQPFMEDLYNRCKALRDYEINFEIVIGASIHKRVYFANYFTGSVDKGFYFFNLPAREVVKDINDHRCEGTFKGVASGIQVPDQLRAVSIKGLKRAIQSVLGRVIAQTTDLGTFTFGDLNIDSSIKNRLYNELI